MWHRGEMSSREFLVLTDGMPEDSWYRVSGRLLMDRLREEEEQRYADGVRTMMFAQLHGQKMGVS